MSRKTVGKKRAVKKSEGDHAFTAGMTAYGHLEQWIRSTCDGPGFETLCVRDREAVRRLHAALGALLEEGAFR